MGGEKHSQGLLVLVIIFVEGVALSTVSRLGQSVTTQNSIGAQTLHKFAHDLVNLSLGEMFNGRIPHDVVERARRKANAYVLLDVSDVWSVVVSFRVRDGILVEIKGDN